MKSELLRFGFLTFSSSGVARRAMRLSYALHRIQSSSSAAAAAAAAARWQTDSLVQQSHKRDRRKHEMERSKHRRGWDHRGLVGYIGTPCDRYDALYGKNRCEPRVQHRSCAQR